MGGFDVSSRIVDAGVLSTWAIINWLSVAVTDATTAATNLAAATTAQPLTAEVLVLKYLGEFGTVGVVLFFLWKSAEKIGKVGIEQGSAAGARLLKFLEDKDEKDRRALKEFGEGIEKSVARLADAIESSTAEQRAGYLNLTQLIQSQQQQQAKSNKRSISRRGKSATTSTTG